jgi:general nucleoside transport system permease protein
MTHKTISSFRFGISLLLPINGSLIVGSIIILVTGNNPIDTFINLFDTGFKCNANEQCASLSTIQFATPLILTGLSAAISLRANFISLGQAGQMLFGAAAVSWIGANLDLPFPLLPAVAILGAAFVAATTLPSLENVIALAGSLEIHNA